MEFKHMGNVPVRGNFFCLLTFLFLALVMGGQTLSSAAEPGPLYFDITETGGEAEGVPVIQPWKTIAIEVDHGGQWVLLGDIDGDGEVEIVSAENHNEGDTHYTSAVAAQKLDGSVLWCWGDPAVGRKSWHHDVACQIHDWDGDGANEVVLSTKGFVVELDGATGEERRRIAIPDDASDCIVFCDLSGKGRASDFLVKNRYHQIWAHDEAGELLWTITNPGGFRTAHQPRPMDIDGDGRDEIMAGYAMLNADGSVRWVYESKQVNLAHGHMDCARLFRKGATPKDCRIVMTCCGANNIAMLDGTGAVVWEVSGRHFESLQVGKFIADHPGPQILVDIDHQPAGKSPIWVMDAHGKQLGQIVTSYCRHHRPIDWTGDGVQEFVVANPQALYGGDGQRVAQFATPSQESGKYEISALVGDVTGDGVPDICFVTPSTVYVYKNEKGRKPAEPTPLGTGSNFTLY
jgi:hypothetical protein